MFDEVNAVYLHCNDKEYIEEKHATACVEACPEETVGHMPSEIIHIKHKR